MMMNVSKALMLMSRGEVAWDPSHVCTSCSWSQLTLSGQKVMVGDVTMRQGGVHLKCRSPKIEQDLGFKQIKLNVTVSLF